MVEAALRGEEQAESCSISSSEDMSVLSPQLLWFLGVLALETDMSEEVRATKRSSFFSKSMLSIEPHSSLPTKSSNSGSCKIQESSCE